MRFGWKASGPTIRSTAGSSRPTAWAIDLEMDPDGLANFLANHPDVKGIGPVKARLIADHFGARFDAAIRSQPEAVAAVAKVPVEIDPGSPAHLDRQQRFQRRDDLPVALSG